MSSKTETETETQLKCTKLILSAATDTVFSGTLLSGEDFEMSEFDEFNVSIKTKNDSFLIKTPFKLALYREDGKSAVIINIC